MRSELKYGLCFLLVVSWLAGPGAVSGTCTAPNNGTGTLDFPPPCPYESPGEPMRIQDGLPPGSTITLSGPFHSFANAVHLPGGTLGGGIDTFDGEFAWEVVGTGDLAGLQRHLVMPVSAEAHTSPRTAGAPVQAFGSHLFRLEGELFGDPDFCALRIAAGIDLGLPSPGETVATRLPTGDFAVDSFFDVTYRIEFEGCPGSMLEGMLGAATATIRLETQRLRIAVDEDGPDVVVGWDLLTGDHRYDMLVATKLQGTTCVAPDNGSGTVDLPADCPFDNPEEEMHIVDGLPPGTAILFRGPLENFSNQGHSSGGTLGGGIDTFDGQFTWSVLGTGALEGFQRSIVLPVAAEVHTGPRSPGDPVQSFDAVLYRLQGELFGDPDFCMLRLAAGTDLGLPGPGSTTLTRLLDGDFAVDSFFDVTYRLEFAGCPGSPLQDLSGTTTDTIRLQHESGTPWTRIEDVLPPWHHVGALHDESDYFYRVEAIPGALPACVAPDNGTGTVDLPADCPYDNPDEEMRIVDGLPPGSTILLRGPLTGFHDPLHLPGGTLGGGIDLFDGEFDWEVIGTGEFEGFSRHIVMPVSAEDHTAPRSPGDPVQIFDTDLFRLQGQLFGDPDFCELHILAGTDLGLPSPGRTTLTKLPSGDFAVDSFFDVTYRIEFEGCPGSQLEGLGGATVETIRLSTK